MVEETFVSYEHFIRHDAEFKRSLDKAQRAHDAEMPPEDNTCDEIGHKWKRVRGTAADGTQFAKCVRCGIVEER